MSAWHRLYSRWYVIVDNSAYCYSPESVSPAPVAESTGKINTILIRSQHPTWQAHIVHCLSIGMHSFGCESCHGHSAPKGACCCLVRLRKSILHDSSQLLSYRSHKHSQESQTSTHTHTITPHRTILILVICFAHNNSRSFISIPLGADFMHPHSLDQSMNPRFRWTLISNFN